MSTSAFLSLLQAQVWCHGNVNLHCKGENFKWSDRDCSSLMCLSELPRPIHTDDDEHNKTINDHIQPMSRWHTTNKIVHVTLATVAFCRYMQLCMFLILYILQNMGKKKLMCNQVNLLFFPNTACDFMTSHTMTSKSFKHRIWMSYFPALNQTVATDTNADMMLGLALPR